MNLLKSVSFIALCGIACFLVWILFDEITPFFMTSSWLWIFLLFVVMACLNIVVVALIFTPIARLIRKFFIWNSFEKIAIGILTALFCFYAARTAWALDMVYGVKEIIVAVLQNLLVLGLYSGMYLALLSSQKDI